MQISVATTTSIVSVCHTCGVVKKSNKRSCCARGGSWYGKCGGADNTNREHTWYEGLQACKALQSQAVMVHQQNAVEQKSTNFSDDASMGIDAKAIHTFASASGYAVAVLGNTSIRTSPNASTRMPMSVRLAHTLARTSIAYDTGTTTSKVITATAITIVHTSVKMSTPRSSILPIKSSIHIQSNRSTNPLANSTNTKLRVREASANVVPPRTPASASIRVQSCENLFHIVTLINMFLVVVVC